MATVTITHSTVTGAAANPNVLVDGPKWDANHVVTGLENVPNVDTTNASNLTSGTVPAARLGPLHVVTYTVAPSGASANDKLRADYVCTGTADQAQIAAAITAATVTNSKVICLPGAYTFSAALTITSANNFIFDATGCVFTGAGGTADVVKIDGANNGSKFVFGTILSSGSGAAIHVTAAAAAVNNTFIYWGYLKGTSYAGKGLFLDATTGPMTVNYCEGGWIATFDKGIVLDATGTTNFIDTTHIKSTFIYDCNTDIYGRSGTGTKNNANIWDVNVDAYINSAVAVDIDHSFDVFTVTWGAQAPSPATTKLLWLRSGAIRNIFYGTPNLYETFGTGYVQDDSGNVSNIVNGATVAIGAAAKGHLVKWSSTYNGILDDGGVLGALANLNVGTNLGSNATTLFLSDPFNVGAGTITTLSSTTSNMTTANAATVNANNFNVAGTTSGGVIIKAPAVAGSNTLTLPAGTTNFSSTGGTSQVVKQTSAGGALTVAQLAASDLSNGTTGSGGGVVLATSPTIATPTITGAATLSGISGHAIGAASPGTGWGLYHAGTINATSGFAINWQTDASLTATANSNTLQGMRITATPVKGAFTSVTSYGLYIAGGSSTPYDFGIRVDDASPVYFGGSLTMKPPASITPVNNGDLTFQATSNTSLTIKYKGSDGTVRSVALTLA